MKAVLVLLSSVLLLLLVEYSSAEAPEKTCKQLVSDITKRQLSGMGKCTKSMKFKNGKDKSAKMMCIIKCVMMKEGVLDAQGYMTKEIFDSFIEKEVPPSQKERAIPVLEKCRTTVAQQLDPSEEFCKSYDPLVKCFLNAVTQLCGS